MTESRPRLLKWGFAWWQRKTVEERRGFYSATGITLFATGLAGFLAYYIGQSALPRKDQNQFLFIPFVCEAISIIGFGFILMFWASHLKHRMRVPVFNDLVIEGSDLLFRLSWQAADEDMEEMERAVKDWTKKVADWLRSNLPEYTSHFLNISGVSPSDVLTSVLIGRDVRRSLIMTMDVRLSRLAEIHMRI